VQGTGNHVRKNFVRSGYLKLTPDELESLRPENLRGKGSQHLMEIDQAKELSVDHLFEHLSVCRPLHAAGMLLRRGIGKLSHRC
jgi:hypothetical protein